MKDKTKLNPIVYAKYIHVVYLQYHNDRLDVSQSAGLSMYRILDISHNHRTRHGRAVRN